MTGNFHPVGSGGSKAVLGRGRKRARNKWGTRVVTYTLAYRIRLL